MDKIIIHTDGACRQNPGRGAYAFVLEYKGLQKEEAQAYQLTTNNRMELMAVIASLEALKLYHIPVHIYSDSRYVVDSINKKWLDNWIKTHFKGGKKNKDLWLRYHKLAALFNQINMHWVKGHNNHPLNERCDELATQAADSAPHYHLDVVFEQESQEV